MTPPQESPAAMTTVAENVSTLTEALRAYALFRDGVGALMLRLAEERDPAALVLLELIRDLEARTGELVVEGYVERTDG